MEELKFRIDKALDTIRPYLQKDGGDVKIESLDENLKLTLKYLGACESCKMNFFTLKTGIEEAIREYVPEIKEITAVNLISLD